MNPHPGMLSHFKLGVSFIYRERQSGIRMMFMVLAIVTLFMTVLNHLTDHTWRILYQKAALAFGSDLVVSSHVPLDNRLRDGATAFELEALDVQTTLTMASIEREFQLISLKAVGQNYPLLGDALVQFPNEAPKTLKHGPSPGSVWVESRLLAELNTTLGSDIKIGQAKFKIGAIVKKEPDAVNSLFLVAPRVIMALEDLSKTQIIQEGSRIRYALWFKGNDKNISSFKAWSLDQKVSDWNIQSPKEGRSPIQRLVKYAHSYLGLIVTFSVMLAGLSISLSTRLWVKKRLVTFGILRVLGVMI